MPETPISLRLTPSIKYTVPPGKYLEANFINAGFGFLASDALGQITRIQDTNGAQGLIFPEGAVLSGQSPSGYLCGLLFSIPAQKTPIGVRITNVVSYTVPPSKYLIANFFNLSTDVLRADYGAGAQNVSRAEVGARAQGLVFTAGSILSTSTTSGGYLCGFLYDQVP